MAIVSLYFNTTARQNNVNHCLKT